MSLAEGLEGARHHREVGAGNAEHFGECSAANLSALLSGVELILCSG